MSAETAQNKAIVQRLYEDVWNRGDLAAAEEILAQPGGVQAYVGQFRSAFPDVRHTVETTVAEGDVVMIHWTAQATHLGQWHGLEATGARVRWSGVTIAYIADRKIVLHQTVWDALALLEQIGAVPRIRKADGSRL
jgi:predicted ester cyclase